MYGYLRDLTLHDSTADKVAYRGYYCNMCRAVTRTFGPSKILLNNRDVVGTAIFLKLNKDITYTAKTCYYLTRKGRAKYTSEWTKMAAYAIALLYGKALDDLHDGDGKKAKKIMKTIKAPVEKLNAKIPGFIDHVDSVMKSYLEAEESCRSVFDQGARFADALLEILRFLFDIEDETTVSGLRTLTLWYCLADAIDDYAEDSKKNRKNPLFAIAKRTSLSELTEAENAELMRTIQAVKDEMLALAPSPIADKEDAMIDYYFRVWCPEKLDSLLAESK